MGDLKITGATAEERTAARNARTRRNRRDHYCTRIADATGRPTRQLEVAIYFLRAVGNDLNVADTEAMAVEVTALAKKWNGDDGE
jgi:hypothetical protein